MNMKLKSFFTLLLALFVQIAFAQEKTVTGTVSDATGPLPGVTVVVKGTNVGTQTDFDGNYSITAQVGDVIVYSFIGMTTVEQTVGASNTINVTMTESAEALEEIVVTGLGIKREAKSLGYSQQAVDTKELTKGRQVDVNNALAGKVAGVQIVGNSSSTFGNSSIKLRGEDGVLYVVDGIFVYATSDINPDNIAEMTVLKGASATAIYGPAGRNGVIVITTKTAQSGQAVVSLDHTTSWSSVSSLPEHQDEYGGGYSQDFNVFSYDPSQDPAEWAAFDGQLYPDFWADESWGPKLDGTLVRHWDSWIPGTPEFGELRPWTQSANGIESFYDTAVSNNTSFNFSKGGENYSIMTSLNHVDRNGIIPNSNQKTINYSINASYDLSDNLSINAILNYQRRTTQNNPDQNYGNLGSNFNQWWQTQLDFDRLQRYERNGQIVSWNMRGPRDARPLYWDMPYFQTSENLKHDDKNATFGKVNLTWKINDKFTATGDVRHTFNSYIGDDRSTTKSLLDPASFSTYQSRNESTQFFGMVTYQDTFADGNLDINASVGGDILETNFNRLSANTNGNLTIPEFYNLDGSQDPVSAGTSINNRKQQGTFVKASLGYKSLLYLDGSYRFDWSSTAQAEDNRINTWGLSGSFIFSKLIPQNEILTFGKLRAGYANAPYFPGTYQTAANYIAGDLYQGNGTLNVSTTQANPDIKGGTRGEFEIGTDLRFANNRINFEFTYFDRTDEDLPVRVPLDGSTGFSTVTVNSGKTTSNGIEVALGGDIIKNENFQWNLTVNHGTLKKQVVDIYPGIDSYDLSTYTSNMKLQARVGEEYGLFYGTGFARHTDGSIIFTSTDRFARERNKRIGSLLPDFTGGLSSTFNYKNFSLFLGMDWQKGGLYYSRTERYMDHSGIADYTAGLNDKGNPLRDPVSAGGGIHIVGVLQTGTDANGNPISDGTVVDKYIDPAVYYNLGNLGNIYENNTHDASYVKLRTVRLDYAFDGAWVGNIGLESASLGVFGDNVWLISSDLPWVDPSELEKRSGINWAENGTLPMTSTWGMNLKLTF